ncbi:MAG: flagellar motor switch protein FliM, partial [Alphaproteobacteria bacterium]
MAEQDNETPEADAVDQDAMAAEWAAAADGEEAAADAGDAAGGESGGDAGGEDQDAVAAEWEAMAGGDDGLPDDDVGGGGGGAPTRVLNQDEIDSLLGFDNQAGDGGARSGISALFNNTTVSYERLPMLEVVFDRVVRLMS